MRLVEQVGRSNKVVGGTAGRGVVVDQSGGG